MADDPDLQKRLETFQKPRKIHTLRRLNITTLAIGLALGGAAIAYFITTGFTELQEPLQTSQVDPFQDNRPPGGLSLEFPSEQRVEQALSAVEEALELPQSPPAPARPDEALLSELQSLRDALAASQTERNIAIQAAVADLRAAFRDQTDALHAELDEREAQFNRLERERQTQLNSLQTRLDAERAQRAALEADRSNDALIRDQELIAQRRQLEAEQRQQEAERQAAERRVAQITSPAVVYSQPQTSAESSTADVPSPLLTEEATQMIRPDQTLSQGTVIQAALQTAINSDLRGNVTATVSEPVYAFSGDTILIPRGSRLFGRYRSGLAINQKRILIEWGRILTPDGTSMQIASIGADTLGRAGLTGVVDTKFDERFGGAALISLIGAGNAAASDTAIADVGSDLEAASRSVIADQLSLSPTIYVDQGASVTVIVDRDIAVY
ncbi:TrbI/VirB10 family protein [Cognatishimia sp. MH4019]|uniref:TrbI/VirB10 family protein n=1 Tax=Cognatishimia sp. MH4019 TaxID=2854030 RepID=UPI001CD1BD4B|nr:TrbI/VirB10 family protein [Cognatishimia sp. MH4019]